MEWKIDLAAVRFVTHEAACVHIAERKFVGKAYGGLRDGTPHAYCGEALTGTVTKATWIAKPVSPLLRNNKPIGRRFGLARKGTK